MFSRLVKQMVEREGVTEQLKAENQMEWVRHEQYSDLCKGGCGKGTDLRIKTMVRHFCICRSADTCYMGVRD